MIDFVLEDQLAELDSDEAANFGVPVRPMTRLELALIVLAFASATYHPRPGERSTASRWSREG